MSREDMWVHGAWPGYRIWFMFLSLPTSPSLVWFTCKTSCLFTLSVLSIKFVSLSVPDPIGPNHLPHPASLTMRPDHRMKTTHFDSLPTSPAPQQASINGSKPGFPTACLLYKIIPSPSPAWSPNQAPVYPGLQALQMRKASSCCACRRGKKMSIRSSVGHAKGSCRPPPAGRAKINHAMPKTETAEKMKADRGSRTQGVETRLFRSRVHCSPTPPN